MMTVCIAAINNKHNMVIIASDRMVTSTSPPIEFEHSIPKIIEVNEQCVALSAGSALRSKELLVKVRNQAREQKVSIQAIAAKIKAAYQEARMRLGEELFLKSRGLNLQIFLEKGGALLRPELYQTIDRQIATLNFQLDLIIAGVDDTGPSIYGIYNPGWMECYDSIGFHSIGTGGMHAIGSLINSYKPQSNEMEAIYSVFRAKKDAEVAPGVGKLVDFGLVYQGQKIKYIAENSEILVELDKLYAAEKEARLGLIQRSKLAKMDIGGTRKDSETTEGASERTEES